VEWHIQQKEAAPTQDEKGVIIEEMSIMEKNSKENKDFIQELFLEALDGIILWDKEGNVLTANAAACTIFECPHHELIGQNLRKLKTLDKIRYREISEKFKKTGAVKGQIFLRIPNGKEKHLEFTCKSHSCEGYIITIFRDNSERYQMERKLRENEQKFRKIFENSIDGLVLWDNQFRIVDLNSAGQKIFGLPKERLIGRQIFDPFTHEKEKMQIIINHLDEVMQQRKNSASMTFDHKNGERKQIEYSTKLKIIDGLNLTVFKDVTEKIEMQEQLRKSDRLNVIGELAAGIAHEIRNPMTALKGFIQLLESSIKKEHAMYYQVITTELARIDSIINEFLILAKPQAIRYQEKDINQIVRETVDLLNAQAVLFNVQFKTSYDENLPLVYCEPNQLKKVFINIIKNAIEVMPEGGNILIITNKRGENQIHISVQDEGMGIPKEIIKKLGEPFYTTKERGTGLGLMVSYKIIEEHRGTIEIESEEGKGTIFHITLPLVHGGRN
jgi:two-component system, sporulation sensor kinase E